MATIDHIHISSTLQGSPEYSPDAEYKVNERRLEIEAMVSAKRSLTGKLHAHVLSDGGPIVFTSFTYKLHVTAAELTTLQAEVGKTVYLVDSVHVADGEDHTPYVRTMFFDKIAEIKELDPLLARYQCNVHLYDADTVT